MRTHLDLCSGIGGFALAARWAGLETVGFCEIDPWCRRVLAKHWPEAQQHDDVTTLDADTVVRWLDGRRLDLVTAGYPCQPFSLAGSRLGAADSRHLWPSIRRIVADVRPRWCLFENVAGHVTLGLDQVWDDLEGIGYSCRAIIVPASAVGAPHRRDRVWIIAADERLVDADRGDRGGRVRSVAGDGGAVAPVAGREFDRAGRAADMADADHAGQREQRRAVADAAQDAAAFSGGGDGARAEAFGGLGDAVDGVSGWVARPRRAGHAWAGDWEAGCARVVTDERDRRRKLHGLGNAIVPQVAYEIIAAIVAGPP